MKKILILGANSYIGRHVYDWLKQYPDAYQVAIQSTRNDAWKMADWANIDTVIDVAGIAHIKNITEDMKPLFYSINRDMTIEIGKYAKERGVKHFIFFSSMNVYGDFCDNLKDREQAHPTSFYGDSKLQGDKGLKKISDESFCVASIRPPFVYGKNCKGNYNTISKVAKKTIAFPTFKNKKSMIYIDNLCEFTRLLIETGKGGIYTPQNRELVSTSELVREISRATNHRIIFTSLFNGLILITRKISRNINRGFGDDCYEMSLSDYWNFKYDIVDFKESIKRTEE